jgi:hypothetical protein
MGGLKHQMEKRSMDYFAGLHVSVKQTSICIVADTQYHGISDAANLDTWKGMSYQTVLTPADEKTGNVIYPYAKAKQNLGERSAMH